MKIIRWLLGHTFLILLIVAVIYGYMFWGNLAGEGTPAGKAIAYLSHEFVEVEEFVNAVKSKQARLAAEESSSEQSLNTADVESTRADKPVIQNINEVAGKTAVEKRSTEQPPVAPQPVAPPPVAPGFIEQRPVNISSSRNQMRAKQDFAGHAQGNSEARPRENISMNSRQGNSVVNDAQSATNAVVMAAATNEAKQTFVPAEIEKQLNNVDKDGKVINEVLPGSTVRESWITARKSFYQRNYALSEQSYKNVIDSTEDNYDAYGELGNVYFNQGKNEQAASAYFEAAAILVDKGHADRASSLIGLLRHLDKAKADELQKLIDSTQS